MCRLKPDIPGAEPMSATNTPLIMFTIFYIVYIITRQLKPDIPGAELAITSNEAFFLPERPKRVIVVGGG